MFTPEKYRNKYRKDCLSYLVENYDTWPEPSATWHTARSHYGYSWTFSHDTGWYLESDLSDDRIVKADFIDAQRNVSLTCLPQQDGSYKLLVKHRKGEVSYSLTAEEFAKFVSGQNASSQILEKV